MANNPSLLRNYFRRCPYSFHPVVAWRHLTPGCRHSLGWKTGHRPKWELIALVFLLYLGVTECQAHTMTMFFLPSCFALPSWPPVHHPPPAPCWVPFQFKHVSSLMISSQLIASWGQGIMFRGFCPVPGFWHSATFPKSQTHVHICVLGRYTSRTAFLCPLCPPPQRGTLAGILTVLQMLSLVRYCFSFHFPTPRPSRSSVTWNNGVGGSLCKVYGCLITMLNTWN